MDQALNSPAKWSIRSERRELIWLILLTLIAGVLRFVSLDRPTIWGDEAATYARISGSYSELLTQLTDRSLFTPLHYETLWWIKQGMPLWGRVENHEFIPSHQLIPGGVVMTPFMLRLIPAIAGTLLIPAFYFLARQLFGPKISVTTAFLACFSAFLLVYSRDAKMYSPCWLFVVLNMACFLWWIRGRALTPWLAWIFTGVTMIGLHAIARSVVVVQLFILLTCNRQYFVRWFRIVMSPRGQHPWRELRLPLIVSFAVGATAIVLPSYYYYQYFNKHSQEIVDSGGVVDTNEAGVNWVKDYNDGRELPDLVMFTTSTFMSGWEWPQVYKNPRVDRRGATDRRALMLLESGNIALLGLLAIGVLPWRKLANPYRESVREFKQDLSIDHQARRRRIFWLLIWLCVVPLVIYQVAESSPVTIFDGITRIALKKQPTIVWPRLTTKPDSQAATEYLFSGDVWQQYFSGWSEAWKQVTLAFAKDNLAMTRLIVINVIALLLTIIFCIRIRWVGRQVIQVLLAAVVLVVLAAVISMLPQVVESSIWMPRYLGVVLPAFLLLTAILINQQPARWLRVTTLAIFVMLNIGQFAFRVWGFSEPPVDRMARDLVDSQPKSIVATNPEKPAFRCYTFLASASGPAPGFATLWNQAGNYYLWLYSRVNTTPWELKTSQIDRKLNYWGQGTPVAADLRNTPSIERFCVWAVAPEETDATDPVAESVKGQFRRISEYYYPCYDHWTWRKTFTVVRREYVKIK